MLLTSLLLYTYQVSNPILASQLTTQLAHRKVAASQGRQL